MTFTFTPIFRLPDVIVIEGQRFQDERGFFLESFRANDFEAHGIPPFIQENHSRSKPNIFRGLHCQLFPKAQGKLVYCTRGAIYDFIVDIRIGSPTYEKYIKIYLEEHDTKMVYVPIGFLHGFLSLPGTDFIDVRYKVSEYYSQEHEQSVNAMDPKLQIIIPNGIELSKKDRAAPLLEEIKNNFHY